MIVFDHTRVVVDGLDVYNVIPYAEQIALGEAVQESDGPAWRQIVYGSPAVAKVDCVKRDVDDKSGISVHHVCCLFMDLAVEREHVGACPSPDDVVAGLDGRLLHSPFAITVLLPDEGQTVLGLFRWL